MTPRLSGHFSIFGLVFFVLKSLLGIARQWILEKFAILTLKPRSHVRISMYRAWAIAKSLIFCSPRTSSCSQSVYYDYAFRPRNRERLLEMNVWLYKKKKISLSLTIQFTMFQFKLFCTSYINRCVLIANRFSFKLTGVTLPRLSISQKPP